ncbi:unnamed protein product, partial [Linum tenue]
DEALLKSNTVQLQFALSRYLFFPQLDLGYLSLSLLLAAHVRTRRASSCGRRQSAWVLLQVRPGGTKLHHRPLMTGMSSASNTISSL